MGDGKAIPGSRQHSIAQWQQYYFSGKGSGGAKPAGSKPSKGQKKGDKGSKGGKGNKKGDKGDRGKGSRGGGQPSA